MDKQEQQTQWGLEASKVMNIEQLQGWLDTRTSINVCPHYLAEQLSSFQGFTVNPKFVQTNMLFAKLDASIDPLQLSARLKEQGILISPDNPMRLVTHLDISRADIDTFLAALKQALK